MSTPGQGRRILHEVLPVDQVARWDSLLFQYPQASFAVDRGYFYGALRDTDDAVRASSLQRLTDLLLARENGPPDITS